MAWFGGAIVLAAAQNGKSLYTNDFEKIEVGKLPEDFLVLDGGFAVREEGGNRFLELPGTPLDTFGVLFGPTGWENISVSTRIHGTGKGRRFPTFGVGLDGVGGYKLRVSPGKKALELSKGDTVVASVPYDWESGKWVWLRLEVKAGTDKDWMVHGKVWLAGAAEPAVWAIQWQEKEPPPPGRPSITASPFAGTAIRFDDLVVTASD